MEENLSEDKAKDILNDWLIKDNWKTEIAFGNKRGADIIASKDSFTWIIEVKGTASRPPMFNNYFLSIIGEILQRMNNPSAKYSIAFPNNLKFRRLWNELPSEAKRRLDITMLIVHSNGEIEELN